MAGSRWKTAAKLVPSGNRHDSDVCEPPLGGAVQSSKPMKLADEQFLVRRNLALCTLACAVNLLLALSQLAAISTHVPRQVMLGMAVEVSSPFVLGSAAPAKHCMLLLLHGH